MHCEAIMTIAAREKTHSKVISIQAQRAHKMPDFF